MANHKYFPPDSIILRWVTDDGHTHSVSVDYIEFCKRCADVIQPYIGTTHDVGFYKHVTHKGMPHDRLAGFVSHLLAQSFLECTEDTGEEA